MFTKDLTNYLAKATGYSVNNNNGKFLGQIAGTMQASDEEIPEYIILKSDHYFGRGYRFLRFL